MRQPESSTKNHISLETKKEEFEYVYVENDGTVRELDNEEIEYLQTEFEPTDGARSYIKSNFKQLTPDNKVWGFILRESVPKNVKIKKTDKKYLEAKAPINILDSGSTIFLTTGIYSIKILGGWSVSLGDFSISLQNQENGIILIPEIVNWRIQSYEFGQRAKKIMSLHIMKPGKYTINFNNHEDIRVRRTNLFIVNLFEKEIPNAELNIWIG